MELLSEPAFTEETVTDIDIIYIGDGRESLTLHEGDTFTISKADRTFTFVLGEETVVSNWDNVLTYKRRKRVVRTPLKGAPIPTSPGGVNGTHGQ